MRLRSGIIAISALLVLVLASCSEEGNQKPNDLDAALRAVGMSTYMCLPNNRNGSIAIQESSTFDFCEFYDEIYQNLVEKDLHHRVTFSDLTIVCGNETYVINGTAYIAYTASLATYTKGSINAYFYTEGLTIDGPRYSGVFSGDMKQRLVMDSSDNGGRIIATMTILTNGTACGQGIANAVDGFVMSTSEIAN